VRKGLVAHHTFMAFLLAAYPSTGPVQPASMPHPAPCKPGLVGEDAGRHMQQLIAAFAGAPCGQA
jgi:hypothetical protein